MQTQQDIAELLTQNTENFIEWLETLGILLQYRTHPQQKPVIDQFPCSLVPKRIRLEDIHELQAQQLILQRLIDKLSLDFDYYASKLKNLSLIDPFISKMMAIQQKVQMSTTASKVNFCIVRNDVMLDETSSRWFQIEYNCIAAGCGFLSDKVQEFHQLMLNTHLKDYYSNLEVYRSSSAKLMLDGVLDCHRLYGVSQACVLTIVNDFELNMFDQRLFELEIAKAGIITIRTTFEELIKHLHLDSLTGRLSFKGKEIFFVYFRHGFIIDHYVSEDHWAVREKMELSRAIKCPSINIQLVNSKKFQEFLQYEEELALFISSEEAKQLRQQFCKIWGFDDLDKQQEVNRQNQSKLLEMIANNPTGYVLKPQREGGGNNFYDHQILDELQRTSPELRAEFTLMERIRPKPEIGYMLKKGGKLEILPCISEVGLFGYFLSDQGQLLKNQVGGYLIRTKGQDASEGGVAAGFAVLDSLVVEIADPIN